MKRAGIHTKLIRVFITQLLLISAATIIGVYASAKIVEDVLVRKALEGEAEHYWELYSSNPEYPLPNTMNLTGFLAVNENHSAVPLEFHDLQPGYGRAALEGHNPIVHVSDNGSARLYLVFDEVQVSQLALYFGIAPLTGVLVVLYLFAWFTYRQSRRAVSPLVRLAKTVADFDIKNAKLAELDFGHYHDTADAEVVTLIEALNEFTGRLEEFINRERNFTRDASHELRTPLTVIKGSTELLKQRGNLSKEDEETVRRVQQTSEDMEALINTLLVLAREEDIQQHGERVVINDVIAEQLDILKDVHDLSAYEIVLKQSSLLEINAPSRVLSILFSNILRNAFNYTQHGKIEITLSNKTVSVTDSGVGMSPQQLKDAFQPFYRGNATDAPGVGLGLSIVKRLCERFNWELDAQSSPGEGTTVFIQFPQAEIIGGEPN